MALYTKKHARGFSHLWHALILFNGSLYAHDSLNYNKNHGSHIHMLEYRNFHLLDNTLVVDLLVAGLAAGLEKQQAEL